MPFPRFLWLAVPALGLLGAAFGQSPLADPAYEALARRAAPLRPVAAELRWQQLPWVTDPVEALKQAREEKRPLFFWAAGGRDRDGTPLERC